jgi:membrane protein implicated in regulation of membrane protease activity
VTQACHDESVPDWLIWLIVAGVFAAAETATLTFVLAMFAGGAAAAAVTAALRGPVVAQIVVALVVTVALLAGLRPIARRHLTAATDAPRTGTDALIGREAVVLSPVDTGERGRVRLNGAEWSARAFDPDQALPVGTVVRVMSIEGATAVVWQEAAY